MPVGRVEAPQSSTPPPLPPRLGLGCQPIVLLIDSASLLRELRLRSTIGGSDSIMHRRATLPVLFASIFAIWFFWPFIPTYLLSKGWIPSENVTVLGQFGDSFGSLSALFSALAFLGVVYTIYQQSTQIKIQQNESAKQQFEKDFSLLLNLLADTRSSISARGVADDFSKKNIFGHEAIKYINERIYYNLSGYALVEGPMPIGLLVSAFDKIDEYSKGSLRPYFRILYNIFERIFRSDALTNEEKTYYGNIVRGLLTRDEVELMSISCLTADADDMMFYIEEFRLLRYMPDGSLRNYISPHYAVQCFESRGVNISK